MGAVQTGSGIAKIYFYIFDDIVGALVWSAGWRCIHLSQYGFS